MNLPRSTFYAAPAEQPFEEAAIIERIQSICAEFPA